MRRRQLEPDVCSGVEEIQVTRTHKLSAILDLFTSKPRKKFIGIYTLPLPSCCSFRLSTRDKSRAHVCAAIVGFATVLHRHLVASPNLKGGILYRFEEVENKFVEFIGRKVH